MSKLLGKALSEARKQHGYSQQQVADAMKISRVAVSQWENGTTDPSTDNLIKVCDFLDLNLTAATSGMVQRETITSLANSPAEVVHDQRHGFRRMSDEYAKLVEDDRDSPWLRDIPVYASAYAGKKADFFRTDEVIANVRRPFGAGSNTYATYVASSVISPRYEQGELIYLTPGRPTAPGDYVAIRKQDDNDGVQLWLLRRVVRQETDGLVCETLTPQSVEKLPVHEILAVHRIMTWSEVVANT